MSTVSSNEADSVSSQRVCVCVRVCARVCVCVCVCACVCACALVKNVTNECDGHDVTCQHIEVMYCSMFVFQHIYKMIHY